MSQMPEALVSMLWATAIPHFFDAQVLAALRPELSDEAERLFDKLQALTFVEEFRGQGYNIHDLTREVLLNKLWQQDREEFLLLSKRATDYFFDMRVSSEADVEFVYHEILGENKPSDRLLGRVIDWWRYFRMDRIQSVLQVFSEHEKAERLDDFGYIFSDYLAGLVKEYSADYKGAERLFSQAKEKYENQKEKNPRYAAILLRELSNSKKYQGDIQNAIPLCEQALTICREQLGSDHLDTATSLHNLALLYQSQGRDREAKPLYVEALEIFRVKLGDHHPSTADVLSNLVTLYQRQERYVEAVRELQNNKVSDRLLTKPSFNLGKRFGESGGLFPLSQTREKEGEHEGTVTLLARGSLEPKSRQVLGINQQAYQALRSALSLNLRRQLFIAVCDSVVLQEQLATQLEDDILFNSRQTLNHFEPDSADANEGVGTPYPAAGTRVTLDRLALETEDAHLPRQILRWIQQAQQHEISLSHLQILGIEQMTRQPAIVQNHFLRSLEKIDTLLPRLNTSLLIWVSWPWLRTIHESAPAFWQRRNGLYEFVGDPTPMPIDLSYLLSNTKAVTDRRAAERQLEAAFEASALGDAFLEDAFIEESFIDAELLEGAITEESGPAAENAVLSNGPTLNSWQKIASDYFAVAYQRRNLIEAGDRTLNAIEPAIAAYEAGLRCIEGDYPGLGNCLNDLGTLYWLRAQQLVDAGQITECMVHSIQLYSQALEQADRQQDPAMVCQLYSNMGAVYSLLAAYKEPADCFRQAVIVYNRAVAISVETASTQEHAMLCSSLGSVYWKLSHYDHEDQVEQHLSLAVEAYQQALPGYAPEDQPLDYAAVQNNIGITYWSLARHKSSVEMYECAITAYQDALTYRTPTTDPAACVITYNNLALAYWDLSKETAVDRMQRSTYQQDAIVAFESALAVASEVNALSEADRAAIHHCLGDVHMQMVEIAASEDDIAATLQKSLQSYLQSIEDVPEESPSFHPRLAAIVANLQFHYDYIGLSGQQNALNQIPPRLIPYVMPMLAVSA